MIEVYVKDQPENVLFVGTAWRDGGWMFWTGVEVEPEKADVIEAILDTYRSLQGFHYERRGNVFRLPPVYQMRER